MTEVDPYDDSVFRYVIMRHQFDPEGNSYKTANFVNPNQSPYDSHGGFA